MNCLSVYRNTTYPSWWETRWMLYKHYFAAPVSRKTVFGSERYMPTHTIKESEVYQTPTATSYFASCGPQMTDSCMTIHTLTVQTDNSVIICGPDLEPNSTDLVLSSINPLVKTTECHFFLRVSRHTDDQRQDIEAWIWYKVVQITTFALFFFFSTCQPSILEWKPGWKSSRQINNFESFSVWRSAEFSRLIK